MHALHSHRSVPEQGSADGYARLNISSGDCFLVFVGLFCVFVKLFCVFGERFCVCGYFGVLFSAGAFLRLPRCADRP
jgi:hypothetical protein